MLTISLVRGANNKSQAQDRDQDTYVSYALSVTELEVVTFLDDVTEDTDTD